jgi:hypothetical protein
MSGEKHKNIRSWRLKEVEVYRGQCHWVAIGYTPKRTRTCRSYFVKRDNPQNINFTGETRRWLRLVRRLRMGGAIPLLLLYAFMALTGKILLYLVRKSTVMIQQKALCRQ